MADSDQSGNNDRIHKLTIWRLQYGKSFAFVANAAGLAETTIRTIESEPRHQTRFDTAKMIADGLGVKVTDLFEESQLVDFGRPPRSKNDANTSSRKRYSNSVCMECFTLQPLANNSECECGSSLFMEDRRSNS